MAHIRKPEFMGNTREEEKDPVYRVVKDLPWSEKEINGRLQAYDKLFHPGEVRKIHPTLEFVKFP